MWSHDILVFALFNGILFSVSHGEAVVVKSDIGNIEGFSDSVNNDGKTMLLTKFLGIPYAEPPIGEHRFMLPVPKAPLNTTYRAISYPPSCFQRMNDSVLMSANYSEDCLFLSIYVPGKFAAVSTLPVMVWIHGGAFVSGTSSVYKSDVLSTFGNVIVVTINYRLGALGFLRSSDGTIPGNQGLWDQHLAIKWVHDNIRYFHGNPDEVTIFGESAGSISVSAQSLFAGNKGLFKRVIGQSGSAFGGSVYKFSNAKAVIEQTGCVGALDSLQCLKTKSAKELIQTDTLFNPVVDGTFLINAPEAILAGKDNASSAARAVFANVDLITGVNSLDGGYQVAYIWPPLLNISDYNALTIDRTLFINTIIPKAVTTYLKPKDEVAKGILEKYLGFEYTDWTDPNNSTKVRDGFVNMSSDSYFFQSAVTTVTHHCEITSRPTYLYEFGIIPTYHAIDTPIWMKGANHADDLIYMFGEPLSNIDIAGKGHDFTKQEKNVSRAMMTMWTNFAKTSNPNMPMDVTKYLGTTWPMYDSTSQSFLKITNQLDDGPIQHRFYPKRMELWLNIIPEILGRKTTQ